MMNNLNVQDELVSATNTKNKPHIVATQNSNLFLFSIGAAFFLLMAILGWVKLQYGFNFTDEGMYMTDGWRMSIGDHLFPDNSTNVTFLYTVFNEYIFKLNPDITLYGFRKLQYCCAIFAMLLLGISVYRWTREFWYFPFTLSLFAFTGLDVNGMASNFSYYVYPHLFITLHIALLLFALKQQQGISRDCLFFLSGIFLWAIGFSLLPLSVTLIGPIALWLLFNFLYRSPYTFSVRNVASLYVPIIFAWLIFLVVNGLDFFDAAHKMYGYISEGRQSKADLFISSIPYILTSLMLVIALMVVGRRSTWLSLGVSAGLSVIIFAIINTNLFGVIPSFWRGWFNTQMWFSSLLLTIWVIVFGSVAYRFKRGTKLDDTSQLLVVLIVPSILMGGLFAFFSTLGPITVQFVAIPTMLALTVFVARWMQGGSRALLVLVLLLWPFYYTMARTDWEFTYFDAPPRYLNSTFKEGFATGIRTNQIYFSMASWMQAVAQKYSRDGDFAIVTNSAPMVYMIIQRRPALNHSWSGIGNSMSLKLDAIDQMMRDDREPKIAFRFITVPMLLPSSMRDETFIFGEPRPIDPTDPIESYLLEHMKLIDSFEFQQRSWVELYVR